MSCQRHLRGPCLALSLLLVGCASQVPVLMPRSIVVYSGERIQPETARMEEVEAWLTPELDRINLDPAFLIRLSAVQEEVYPWDGLEIVADTADLVLTDTAADAETPFLVYGYLRLMDARGALVEAYPGTEGLTGYILERAILERVAEVWLLGRSVFDTQPYAPLDELVYASEFGYLDDFIFATQPDRFPGEEAAHRTENPGREEEFRSWFRNTFGSDGPRFIRAPDEQSESADRRGVAGPRAAPSRPFAAEAPGAIHGAGVLTAIHHEVDAAARPDPGIGRSAPEEGKADHPQIDGSPLRSVRLEPRAAELTDARGGSPDEPGPEDPVSVRVIQGVHNPEERRVRAVVCHRLQAVWIVAARWSRRRLASSPERSHQRAGKYSFPVVSGAASPSDPRSPFRAPR